MIFEEILSNAEFPAHNKNDGNAFDLIGERIGGDLDDWALQTLNIPSVTNELGRDD